MDKSLSDPRYLSPGILVDLELYAGFYPLTVNFTDEPPGPLWSC